MTYPLVQKLAADGLPVAVTCRVLGFSRQGYYKWRACPVTDAQWRQAHLINAAHDIYADDPEFGYRLIADDLKDAGYVVSENTVHPPSRQVGIVSVIHRKKGTGRKAGPPVHDDPRPVLRCGRPGKRTRLPEGWTATQRPLGYQLPGLRQACTCRTVIERTAKPRAGLPGPVPGLRSRACRR
jgi:hypothetical protein